LAISPATLSPNAFERAIARSNGARLIEAAVEVKDREG
jgi:hypothetical protein